MKEEGYCINTALEDQQESFLVTIICVTRNAAKTIQNLIDSIKKCKTTEVELLILDGNSTDETIEIFKKNQDVINYWRSEPDNGIYDAMNKSIPGAKGKWILFMGADDLLLHGFQQMLPSLQDEKTIYYGGVIYQDGKTVLCKPYDAYYLTKLNICQQCIFYPKNVFDKYTFDETYPVCADYNLNLKCWHDPEFKFQFVDCLIADYCFGGFSTQLRDKNFYRDREEWYKKYLGTYAYLRFKNRTYGFMSVVKSLVTGDF